MTIKDLFKELVVGFAILPMLIAGGVFADYFYLNDPATIYDGIGTNVFTLKSNANFDTEGVKVVQIQGRGTYPRLHTLFRNGSGLYHIVTCQGGYSCQNIHTSIKEQGFYTRYCETTYDNICSNLDLDISGFINNPDYANPDRLFLKNEGDLQYFNMCFQYEYLDKSICVYSDNVTEVLYNSLGLTNNPYISDMDSTFLSLITNSPFVGSSDNPSYEIGDNYYTNGQIVEGYEYLGLDIGYCYGGFPIDDIFEPNQTIEDFTGYEFGVGATIWDLYDLYSGAYSTPKQFFQQMLQAYMNGQINRFKTEPKALIMFVQQFVSGRDRGRLNVGFYDIWDYCNLKFDNVDLNAQYTGNNKTPINGLNQKKASDSNLGGFQFTGDNAFNIIVGTGGSGNISASEFFGNLTSRFQNGLGTVNTNYIGMIPTYILMFMFALIFIRLISH